MKTDEIHFKTMERIFANVGLGLFAVERRGTITIVYDCGGENCGLVQQAIRRVLRHDEVIEALFVSHYDRDHINGVRYLLQHHEVKRLFLPMIPDPVKLQALMTLDPESNEYKFINRPAQIAKEWTRDHKLDVLYIEESLGEGNSPNQSTYFANDLSDCEKIPSGCSIHFDSYRHWLYIPFCLKRMTDYEIESFMERLGLPSSASSEDVKTQWEKLNLKMKQSLLNSVGITKETINQYSMTLYSGSSLLGKKIGCLYTGDYDAKHYMNELKVAYNRVWNDIHVVQIPHHGSEYNFDSELILDAKHVISGGNPEAPKGVDWRPVRDQIIDVEKVCRVTHGNGDIHCVGICSDL